MKKWMFIGLVVAVAIVCGGCAKRAATGTEEENVEITKIYNLVILDRSGSMTPLREAAINGYNATLDVIRTAQEQYNLEQQNLVTLVLFNNEITKVYDCDTIRSVPDLLWENYVPDSTTAMHDALGISLSQLQQLLDSLENATAVVTLISDGMENASRIYQFEQVVAMIDTLKAQGVMFVYMGTNMYVKAIARALHFDEYKEFEYTADGMKDAWASGIKASSAYYERMAQYNQDTRGMTKEERNSYYRDRNKEDGWFER